MCRGKFGAKVQESFASSVLFGYATQVAIAAHQWETTRTRAQCRTTQHHSPKVATKGRWNGIL